MSQPQLKSHKSFTHSRVLTVIQQNVNGQIAASYILEREARLNSVDIMLVQEPYVSSNKSFGLSLYNRAVFKCSEKRNPRTVTIIRNKLINTIAIPENTHWLTGIIVEISSSRLVLLNAYLSPSTSINLQLNTLSKVILRYSRYPLILVGDFNCRSTRFGDVKCNARGRALEEFVRRYSLILASGRGGPTHLNHNGVGQSCVDITFVNAKASKLKLVKNWSIRDAHCSTSDHRLIQFTVEVPLDQEAISDAERSSCELKSYMYGHLSTEELCSILSKADMNSALSQGLDIDSKISLLVSRMQSAIISSKKSRKYRKSFLSSSEFWTDELEEHRNQVRHARKTYQVAMKSNLEVTNLKRQYNSVLRIYRRLILQSKRKCWFDSCETSPLWSAPYKFAIDKLAKREDIDYLTCDGIIISEAEQIKTIITRRFFPADNADSETNQQKLLRNALTVNYSTQNLVPVIDNEIRTAVYRLHPKKAPGLDGINVKILRALWKTNSLALKNVVNDIFRSGIFPSSLKSSKLVLLRKPGKTENDIKCFRPVSLVPAMSKVLEQIILDRLLQHLRENNHIWPNQYGFTKGRSTVDMLCDIMEHVHSNRTNNLQTALISLDIQGAFDNAWHCNIFHELERIKAPSYLISLVKTYLESRTAVVTIHGKQYSINTTRGCPQGSVLGPTLWNVNITSILNKQRSEAKIYAYADDLIVVVTSESIPGLLNNIKKQIHDIQDELCAIKLTLSVEKTKFMVLHKFSSAHSIDLHASKVQVSKSMQILGVIIDYRLSFTDHLTVQVDKVKELLRRFRCLSNNMAGAKYLELKRLYQGCVVPKITYGAPVWFYALDKKCNLAKLQSVGRLYNIFITKSYRTVSAQASSVIAANMPLKFAIKQNAISYHEKNNYVFARHRLVEDLDREPKLTLATVDRVAWSKPFVLCCDARIGEGAAQNMYVINRSRGEDTVSLICSVGPGGTVRSSVFLLNNCLTGLERELIGALLALKHFAPDRIQSSGTSQYSTNLYVEQPLLVSSLVNGRSGNHIVNHVRELMLSKGVIVICTMDMSDEVRNLIDAKLDTDEVFRINDLSSARLVKQNSYRLVNKQWNDEWLKYEGARTTKTIFPTVESRLTCSTAVDFYLSQIFSAHGNFADYLFRFGKATSDHCVCGDGSKETVEHVLAECSRFNRQRRLFFEQTGLKTLSLSSLLDIFKCKHNGSCFRAFVGAVMNSKRNRIHDEVLDYFGNDIFQRVSRLLKADLQLRNQRPREIQSTVVTAR